MSFNKWFEKQSRLIQLLLLLIPVVGWIVEILVRLSALLTKTNLKNVLGFIFGLIIPVFSWLDLLWVLLFKHLVLCD
ncbi:MAG: hypothetical protein K2N65_03545 [Anaeroplasmataceae bacterium]|nr:hypothetical protein [Anaeroplasmataceae bacterium]